MNVFITGISRGLGRALANLYASDGHRVFGISRTLPAGLPETIAHRTADVCAPGLEDEVTALCEGVDSIDLLINNAGSGSFGTRLEEVSPEEVSRQLQLHCVAPLQVTRALLSRLRAAPAPKIVLITSRFGSLEQNRRGDFKGIEVSYAYRIAKAAQNMLGVCMAGDSSLSGILVASINPGIVRTDLGGASAPHSADEAALRISTLVSGLTGSGYFHAFGEEVLY